MGCCGLLRDGHESGGCWWIVGDGGGGLGGGLLLAMVAGVGCWGGWGHRGPLGVLVYCELWWTVAEWVLGLAP